MGQKEEKLNGFGEHKMLQRPRQEQLLIGQQMPRVVLLWLPPSVYKHALVSIKKVPSSSLPQEHGIAVSRPPHYLTRVLNSLHQPLHSQVWIIFAKESASWKKSTDHMTSCTLLSISQLNTNHWISMVKILSFNLPMVTLPDQSVPSSTQILNLMSYTPSH